MRNAKIVCTLGPATDSAEQITALAEAGMSVGRLNASHGSPEHRREMIDRIDEVDDAVDAPVASMLDTPGPEVRTAPIDAPIRLEKGSTVRFAVGADATPGEIGLSRSIAAVDPGDHVLLDDGRIETTVERVDDDAVFARVENGGELGARKGVNVPGVELGLPTITEDDEVELDVAAEKEPDFVAASFVGSGEDVAEINRALADRGVDIPVVAKIERLAAVRNIDSIAAEAYGVMVARGDLGVECPLEDVPIFQKRIIRRCHRAGVPVITATEMLDSMTHARRPTRAEASDVANAVLDGTDAVMLSGETAVGDHPARVVETMDRIVRDVEDTEEYAESRERLVPDAGESKADALARSGRFLARDIGADAIAVATQSGYTALKAAKYRPGVPVVASTPSDRVRRRLALSWGVTPMYTGISDREVDTLVEGAVQSALDAGVAESGDTVVVFCGMMTELESGSTTNMMKVHVAAEVLARGRSVVEGMVTGPIHRLTDADLVDVPDGAVVAVPDEFDDEFRGDTGRIGAIVDAHEGTTGYAAIVARERSIPMISDASVPGAVDDGSTVTLDAERGVLYDGAISREARDGEK
ncbi:pyruvate kinase [Natronoarchaeum rubrum]|uniref:pyruvate kinase n=1 Tax=Natronoarchaeum rubrum TaxID=755311 RepID=UPI00211344CB|nr:pyruvate kinase [Natronoarchaeum rubrum]